MKMVCVVLTMVMLVFSASVTLAKTTIETNGFYLEGVGYITTATITDRNPWAQNVTKIVGYNEKGEKVFDADGSGEGWINGFWKGGFAGIAQGGGIAGAGALLRPSNYSGGNASANGGSSGASATGGNAGAASTSASTSAATSASTSSAKAAVKSNVSVSSSIKSTFNPTNCNSNFNLGR